MQHTHSPNDSDATAATIRLLIVDDHELVREGLRLTFLGSEIEVVAEAADGETAFQIVLQLTVDVAVVDIRMPVADGMHFLQRLHEAKLPAPAVLMHTANDGSEIIRRCRELGAQGLLLKGQDSQALRDAIRRVFAGERLWEEPHRGSSGWRTTLVL
jgi:DNA-binding NarL/FixJ family response regulator